MKITLTEQEVDRWNFIRSRADLDPISREDAEKILAKLSKQAVNEILDRIR